jgi:hypothetical protein
MRTYNKQKRRTNENKSKLSRLDDIPIGERKIWAKFTYFGEDIRILTKIFRKSMIKVAYSTSNTVRNCCKVRTYNDKYSTCGVYELKCLTCDQVYVGQTGRNFRTRYEDPINDIRLNNDKSRYAPHILQQNLKYGPIDETY